MSRLEVLAVLLGLANIVLLVRRSIWNYPFGLATVALQGWLFFGQRLYSDTLLQLFFAVLNLYGWINWRRAMDERGVPVRWMTRAGAALAVVGAAVATALWGAFMHRYTDASRPWWDGAVAMMSVLAQWLLARRFIDNWLWWIAVDLAAVPLYWSKDLRLIAALYVVNLILSVVGLLSWIAAGRAGRRAGS